MQPQIMRSGVYYVFTLSVPLSLCPVPSPAEASYDGARSLALFSLIYTHTRKHNRSTVDVVGLCRCF